MERLKKLEKMGYDIKAINNKLILNYKSGVISDFQEAEKLIKSIKDDENNVIDFLKERDIRENHKVALKYGYLPYSFNECYGKQLSNNSFYFIQKIDNSQVWTGYRLTYNDFLQLSSEKTIVESTDFTQVLNRSERYINNYINFIEG